MSAQIGPSPESLAARSAALRLLAEVGDDLPLPGSGATRRRWSTLTALCVQDASAGRLVEAHADADAILAEIAGERTRPGQLWGVWAAEPQHPVVTADESSQEQWVLRGTKPWCSGAQLCSNALLTARVDGEPRLFQVDLSHAGVGYEPEQWVNAGMAATGTSSVVFDSVPARAVGHAGSYLDRPGFWHGGIGVAACWLGSGIAVAEALRRTVASGNANEHQRAHLGAIDVAISAAQWSLDGAAAQIDSDCSTLPNADQQRALRLRCLIADTVDDIVRRVGRALGAAPLAHDAAHARACADAQMYVRQSHAERDFAALGLLSATRSAPSHHTEKTWQWWV